MKLTWHVVKKDLRRHWAFVLVYAAFVAIKLAFGAVLIWRPDWSDQDAFHQFLVFAGYAKAVEFLVAYFLAAAVVHEDPLVGSRAFWMTKPVSGLRFLGAKFGVLFLTFGVLPVLVTLPWWLACGLDAMQTVAAIGELWFWNGVVLLFALPLAVLTDTTARFLLVSLLGLATWLAVVFPGFFSTEGMPNTVPPGVFAARVWIICSLLVVGGIAVVLHQYRTRRTRVSAGILATMAAGIIAVGWCWPWRWATDLPRDNKKAASLGRDISIELRRATLTNDATSVQLWLAATGIPSGYSLLGVEADLTWSWRDGPRLDRFRQSLRGVAPTAEISVAALVDTPVPAATPEYHVSSGPRDRSGDPRDLQLGPINELFTTSCRVPRSLAPRFKSESPALELTLRFVLAKPQLVGESNAAAGSVCTGPLGSWRVLATPLEERSRELNLVRWIAAPWNSENNLRPGRLAPTRLMLTNSTRAAVVLGRNRHSESTRIAGVAISWQKTPFPARRLTDGWLLEGDWAHGTRLRLLDYRPETPIQNQLKLEAVTVEHPTRPRTDLLR